MWVIYSKPLLLNTRETPIQKSCFFLQNESLSKEARKIYFVTFPTNIFQLSNFNLYFSNNKIKNKYALKNTRCLRQVSIFYTYMKNIEWNIEHSLKKNLEITLKIPEFHFLFPPWSLQCKSSRSGKLQYLTQLKHWKINKDKCTT